MIFLWSLIHNQVEWTAAFCCTKHTKLCILYVKRLEAEVINVRPWHWTIEHSQWLQSQTTTMINWRCSLFSRKYLHKMLNNLLLNFLEFNFCISQTTIKCRPNGWIYSFPHSEQIFIQQTDLFRKKSHFADLVFIF